MVKILLSTVCIAIFCVLITWSCARKASISQVISPVMNTIDESKYASEIILPVKIFTSDLEALLNKSIPTKILKDSTLSDDESKTSIERKAITIYRVQNLSFSYKVPLVIGYTKSTLLGNIISTGVLELDLTTTMELKNDWSYTVKSNLNSTFWSKTPVTNISGLSIPVTFIADNVIKYSKSKLLNQLDYKILSSFDLRSFANTLWKTLHQPLSIPSKSPTWFTLALGPLQLNTQRSTNAEITWMFGSNCLPQITVSDQTPNLNIPTLSNFQSLTRQDEITKTKVLIKVPYYHLDKMIKEEFRNYIFDYNNKKITIKEISVIPQGNNLIIDLLTDGYYKGQILLTGTPKINQTQQILDFENLHYSTDTKSLFFKTVDYLFHNRILSELKKKSQIPLTPYLSDIQKTLNAKMTKFPVNENVLLNGNVQKLQCLETILSTNGLLIIMEMEGTIYCRITP